MGCVLLVDKGTQQTLEMVLLNKTDAEVAAVRKQTELGVAEIVQSTSNPNLLER